MWAAVLALCAILLFLRALEIGERRWFIFAALVYFASILIHEEFVLLPPVFITVHLLLKGGYKDRARNLFSFSTAAVWRLAAYSLGLFLIPMAAYGFWREVALPSYGGPIYSPRGVGATLAALRERFLLGVKMTFVPVDDALRQITLEFPPAGGYLLLSGILSAAVWAIILRLRLSETGRENSQQNLWPHAAVLGVAMAAGAILVIALAPVYIGGVVGTGWSSRVNFVMTVGAALAVPALLGLLMSPYNRFTPVAGLLGVSFFLYIGFSSPILGMDKLLRFSTFFTILGEYSLKHRLTMFGGVVLITLLTLMIILSSTLQLRRLKRLPSNDRLETLYFRVSGHFSPQRLPGSCFWEVCFISASRSNTSPNGTSTKRCCNNSKDSLRR